MPFDSVCCPPFDSVRLLPLSGLSLFGCVDLSEGLGELRHFWSTLVADIEEVSAFTPSAVFFLVLDRRTPCRSVLIIKRAQLPLNRVNTAMGVKIGANRDGLLAPLRLVLASLKLRTPRMEDPRASP
jgi:hypothetical protein